MKSFRFALGLVVIGAVFLNSCVKQSYSNPPDLSSYDPNLPVNLCIRDLIKPYWAVTTSPHRVLGDSIISGIVTADDRSGNFYKQIIIQDSTGAISIAIDNTYVYSKYPIGRKVYIKLKGLTLINYNGSPEICYYFDPNTQKPVGIVPTFQDTFIVQASYPHIVTPKEITYDSLKGFNYKYIYMLLKVDNMEIQSAYLNLPYASPSGVAISTARYIVSCNNGVVDSSLSLELYNSGFANFYYITMPSGTGSITGIFSIYGRYSQFQIRDTSDVQFTQSRCH